MKKENLIYFSLLSSLFQLVDLRPARPPQQPRGKVAQLFGAEHQPFSSRGDGSRQQKEKVSSTSTSAVQNNSKPTQDDGPTKFPLSRQHVDCVSLEKRKVGNAAVCTGKERKTGEESERGRERRGGCVMQSFAHKRLTVWL